MTVWAAGRLLHSIITRTRTIALAAALALLGVPQARADDVRVDVVVDFNAGAYKLARPSRESPTYYLPLALGLRNHGSYVPLQAAPPPNLTVQHLLAKALYDQGYRVMTREHPATLAIVFRWGVMAPRQSGDPSPARTLRAGGFQPGQPGQPGQVVFSDIQLSEYAPVESREMLSLVGGDTFSDRHIDVLGDRSVATAELLEMARHPRFYLMVSAYDFPSWMEHFRYWQSHDHSSPAGKDRNPKLLWEAHVSTEAAGRELAWVLPTLINTAAPFFGRETKEPQLISPTSVPPGEVHVGIPTPVPDRPAGRAVAH